MRKLLITSTCLFFLFFSFISLYNPIPAQAGAPALLRLGKEAVEILAAVGARGGIKQTGKKAMDVAKDRWNHDNVKSAKGQPLSYIQNRNKVVNGLNRARAKAEPLDKLPGWGKVLVTGALFLTGLDILYDGYMSMQDSKSSGGSSATVDVEMPFINIPPNPINFPNPINDMALFTYRDFTFHYLPGESSNGYTGFEVRKYGEKVDKFTGNDFTGLKKNPDRWVLMDLYGAPTVSRVEEKETDFEFRLTLYLTGNLKELWYKNKQPVIGDPIPEAQVTFKFDKMLNPGHLWNQHVVPVSVPELAPLKMPKHLQDLVTTTVPNHIPDPLPNNIPKEVEIIVPLPNNDKWTPEEIAEVNKPGTDPLGNPDPGTGTNPDPGTGTNPDPGTGTNPDPGTGTNPDPGTGTNPDPSGPDTIRWDKLKQIPDAFINAFPFSIPFDIANFFSATFGGLDSNPDISIKGKLFGEEITLTIPELFKQYLRYIQIFVLVMFDISLLYAVRQMLGGAS